jgi:hypothetical protein
MMMHMASFCLMGFTIFTLMLGQTKSAITGSYDTKTRSWIYYFSIVLIFVSNIILLHIFNYLVNNELVMKSYGDDEDMDPESGSVFGGSVTRRLSEDDSEELGT